MTGSGYIRADEGSLWLSSSLSASQCANESITVSSVTAPSEVLILIHSQTYGLWFRFQVQLINSNVFYSVKFITDLQQWSWQYYFPPVHIPCPLSSEWPKVRVKGRIPGQVSSHPWSWHGESREPQPNKHLTWGELTLVTGHPIVWAGERRWPLSAAPRVWLRLMLIGSPACGQTTFIFICRQEQKGWEFHSRANRMWNEIRITVPIPGMYLEFSRETYLCMQSLASLWFIFCTYLHNRVLDNTLYFSWMPRGRGAPYRTWPRRRGISGTRYIFCDGPGLPSRLICPVNSVLDDISLVLYILLTLETSVWEPDSQDSHTEAPNHPPH